MIWEAQKDVFFKRWRNQNPKVVDFDSSITQYIELSNKVQQVDTITAVEFVLLDCSGLKFGIIAHCDEWQTRFHGLLHEMASQKLNGIHSRLEENTKKWGHSCVYAFSSEHNYDAWFATYVEYFMCAGHNSISPSPHLNPSRLKTPPETLEQLGDSLGLLEQLQGDIRATEAEFEPLRDMFKILGKYEVDIPEEDEAKLERLPKAWVNFQQCLIDSEVMMKKHKVGGITFAFRSIQFTLHDF